MKRIVMLILFLFIPFFTSCFAPSNPEADASSDSDTASFYAETISTYTPEFPYQDFSAEYGDLKDYDTDEQGNAVFLYKNKQSTKKNDSTSSYMIHGPDTDVVYDYHIMLYDASSDSYLEQQLDIAPDVSLSHIVLSPDKTILLFDLYSAYVYEAGSEVYCADFPAFPAGGILFLDDGKAVCKIHRTSGYYVMDLKTGETLDLFLAEDFLYAPNCNYNTFLSAGTKAPLLVTGNGIYEYQNENWQLMVPSERTSLYRSDFIPTGVSRVSEENYVVFDFAYQYSYIPAEPTDNEPVTLTLFSVEESPFLKNAIFDFQMKNPNITISYDFLCAKLPSEQQAFQTLIQQVNTNMVSRQPADIYILDDLPWENYVEKEYLLDMQELVAPYVNNANYYADVLTGYSSDNGLYAVPLCFQGDFILCKDALIPYVNKLHDFADFLRQHPEEAGLVPYHYKENPSFFIAMLFQYYQKDLYEGNTITLNHIATFLNDAQVIYDRLCASQAPVSSYKETYPVIIINSYIENELWQLLGEKNGNVCFYTGTLKSVYYMQQCWKYEDGYSLIPTGNFHPKLLVGIHASTSRKEAASSFVQYLISSYEYNSVGSMLSMGVPIYRPCISEWMNVYRTAVKEQFQISEEYYYTKDFGKDFPMYLPDETDRKTAEELFGKCSFPMPLSDSLTNPVYAIFKQPAIDFLNGRMTLTQAANDIYSRISLLQKELE